MTTCRQDLLAAPCRFCGYNGECYWQSYTHARTCPWFHVGGEVERNRIYEALVVHTLPAVVTCEGSCNPYIATCGARFCAMEEMAQHIKQSHGGAS